MSIEFPDRRFSLRYGLYILLENYDTYAVFYVSGNLLVRIFGRGNACYSLE